MPLSKPKETVSKDAAAKAQAAPSVPREEAAQPPAAGTHIHTLLPFSFKPQALCKLIISVTVADFFIFVIHHSECKLKFSIFDIINAPTFVSWKSNNSFPLHNGGSLYSLLSCGATSQTTEEEKNLYSSAREDNNMYCQMVMDTKQNLTDYVAFITKLIK